MATAQLGTLLRHIQKLAAGSGVQQWTDRQLLDDFAVRRDETVFTTLVSRHGPMVLRVCRRVLNHEQDAEDAFQATFLVLARNVGSIRKREAMGDWLHGVAYRTAMKAKRGAARRRNHEGRHALGRGLDTTPQRCQTVPHRWGDVQAVLDEEIQHLPETFRSAFVLCVLEGKGGTAAAVELGVKEGTVKSRVNRAHHRLQQRLARRGIKLAALLAVLSLAESATSAGLPAVLAQTTIRFGLLVAAGESAAAVIPTHIAALAAGVTRAMLLSKAKIAIAVLLVLSLSAASLVTCQALAARETHSAAIQEAASVTRKPEAKGLPKAAESDKETIEVSGRVLDLEGKPIAGANIFLLHYLSANSEPAIGVSGARATTDGDGRFQFRAARPTSGPPEENAPSFKATVTAVATGYGPAWATTADSKQPAALTLKLVKDDVPIEGRVVDLEGKPIQGVTVRVMRVIPMARDDLKPWLDAVKGKENVSQIEQLQGPKLHPATVGMTTPVTSDADGRFRLTGAGRERIVTLRFEGPTIETRYVNAITCPTATIRVSPEKIPPGLDKKPDLDRGADGAFHGANFLHAAAPTRPIIGTVTDRNTGRPLAGAVLQARIPSAPPGSLGEYLRVTTDTEGRYRLVGLPGTTPQGIEVLPPAGQPYLGVGTGRAIQVGGGTEPIRLDFELKRGVTIRGRVIDKATGKAVRAEVRYFALPDNPHLNDAPGFKGSRPPAIFSAEDGSFTLIGLPGPGVVAAKAVGAAQGRYITGYGAEAIKGAERENLFITLPERLPALHWNTLAEVSPKPGEDLGQCDVILDPGKTVTGVIVGPDGKPVEGVKIEGSWGSNFRVRALPTAEFALPGVNPRKPRPFFFHHPEKKLGAAVLARGDEPKGFTVRLQPTGTITGRIVDDDGQPVGGLRLAVVIRANQETYAEAWFGFLEGTITDKDGRFQIPGMIPGINVSLGAAPGGIITSFLIPEATLRPGETKDFDELKLKPPE